jgi:hypothetical protein
MGAGYYHHVISVRKPTRLAYGKLGALVANDVHSGKSVVVWLGCDGKQQRGKRKRGEWSRK